MASESRLTEVSYPQAEDYCVTLPAERFMDEMTHKSTFKVELP